VLGQCPCIQCTGAIRDHVPRIPFPRPNTDFPSSDTRPNPLYCNEDTPRPACTFRTSSTLPLNLLERYTTSHLLQQIAVFIYQVSDSISGTSNVFLMRRSSLDIDFGGCRCDGSSMYCRSFSISSIIRAYSIKAL